MANVAIIAAAAVTTLTRSALPDLVGLGILLLNLDASRQVYSAVQDERSGISG